MADEVDKFVLQYNVELKDSIQKLNELHEKMEKANNKGEEGAKKIGTGVKDAVGHLDKLIPGLSDAHGKAEKLGGVIGKWGPGIGAATVGLLAMAYAMKQVNNMREEYNAQRQTAWDVGMSPIQVEQTQRELTAASGGKLNGAQGRDLMSKIQGKLSEAYTDPNPANATNFSLQMAGTSAYNQNGTAKSTEQALDEIGNKMRHVSAEQANAIGQTIGLTQNETQALMMRNQAVVESQKLSEAETTRRVAANAAMESLNASFGSIDETFRRTGNIVAGELMPIFADAMKVIAEWLSGLPENVDSAITAFSTFNKAFEMFMQDIQDPKKLFTGKVSFTEDWNKAAEIIAKQNEAAKVTAEKQAQAAQTQKEASLNNEKAIKLFGSTVNKMAGVVDEQQAWAAWAGSVGAAAGLHGMGAGPAGAAAASGGGNGNSVGGYSSVPAGPGASTAYNTGNIRAAGGGFRVFNNFDEGIQAQANQLRRYSEGKTTGRKLQTINDIVSTWAPSNENNTRSYIKYMTDKMGIKGDAVMNFNNPEVLGKFMYYQAMMEKGQKNLGGLTEKDFVRNASGNSARSTAAPGDYTRGTPNGGIYAETRNSAMADEVLQSVVSQIGGGMSVSQLRNHGALKSDIRWGLNQERFESARAVTSLEQQANSPQLAKNRAQIQNELNRARQHLNALNQNYNTILGYGQGSANGPRSITMDRPEININLIGGNDPRANAEAVKDALHGATVDITNNNNSALSH